ncbi:MAG: hypothetical protein M1269_07565 [Chloroflexi bacterium]|nr:hypothetical protein [Chloroflexota bacterium]
MPVVCKDKPEVSDSGTGPASGLVSNIASSSPSIGQNTKLLLTNNKTPLYTYTDFASQGGGSHQVEVGVFHYNITDTIGSYTGQYFVQKSKNYNFVMWSGLNETGTEPLLFANEVHFNRDHEGKLREEIDGMASDSLLYGASEEPMTKTEAQAWCAELTDNEITQWYEVWIDGKRHLVYECHVVHVLAPPMVEETYKVVYENCSCHEGEDGWGNTDDGEGIREIGVSTALQIPRSADSDSGEYDCHYEFTINGTTYHSDIRPLLQRNFAVEPPKLTNEILTKAEEIDPSAGTGAMNIITASVLGTVSSPVRSGKVVTLKSSAIWGLIKAGMSVKFSSGGRTVSAVISSINQASGQITRGLSHSPNTARLAFSISKVRQISFDGAAKIFLNSSRNFSQILFWGILGSRCTFCPLSVYRVPRMDCFVNTKKPQAVFFFHIFSCK